MKREFNVDATVGKPQVAYRETIQKNRLKPKANLFVRPAVMDSTVTAGCALSPSSRRRLPVRNKIVGGVIPKEFISPIEAGVKAAMEDGVVAGYPMVDLKVTVFDGSYHEVDSSELAFKIAGSMDL